MGAATAKGTPPGLGASERRVLNPRPFRVFRKTYSVAEVKAGAGVLVVLATVASWVAFRGAHPDPSLLADPALLAPQAAGPSAAEVEGRRAPDGAVVPGATGAAAPAAVTVGVVAPAAGAAAKPADRGALPPVLAGPGWTEGAPSRFDADNLYVKINGRADFFLARGFRSLTFVTLTGPSGAVVDVELFDLGSPENALGTFTAEKDPATKAASAGGTSWYLARNALFVARGSSYLRAIGSDESPAVLAQLGSLRKSFEGGIAAGEKPWTVALFGGALGVPPDKLQYAAENAFSFGFARNVTSATLEDGETELFVLPAGEAQKAKALAAKFEEGFLSYGEKAEAAGASWAKDRYLSTFSRAFAAGTMVVGVRGAPDPVKASEQLAALEKAVLALPPEVARKAAEGPPRAARKGGSYE